MSEDIVFELRKGIVDATLARRAAVEVDRLRAELAQAALVVRKCHDERDAARNDSRRDAEEIARLRRCLSFFVSVIKSGEDWSETCEQEYRAALAPRPMSHIGPIEMLEHEMRDRLEAKNAEIARLKEVVEHVAANRSTREVMVEKARAAIAPCATLAEEIHVQAHGPFPGAPFK